MALVKLDFLNFKIMKSTWRHASDRHHALRGHHHADAGCADPDADVRARFISSTPSACVLAYFMEKKDKAAYPEYYAQIEKDEKELEAAVKR
jgi:hypothetical protein